MQSRQEGSVMTQGCKGCSPEFKVTDERIRRILDQASLFPPERCVSDEQYQARLAKCADCPKLQDGITCLLCGCLIPVVAKWKDRSCPMPGDNRWESELTS